MNDCETPNMRVQSIFQDSNLSQRKFAKSIDIAGPGLNRILKDKGNVSKLLANSIELRYGYSSQWILFGEGESKVGQLNSFDNTESQLEDTELKSILTTSIVNQVRTLAEIGKENGCQSIQIDNISIVYEPKPLSIGSNINEHEEINDDIIFRSAV